MAKLAKAERAAILAKMGQHLRREAPTITRSDTLAVELMAEGLGPKKLASVLKEMLEAEMPRDKWVKLHEKWVKTTIMVPDTKTRLAAAGFLRDVYGYQYMPEKAPKTDPLVVIINQLPAEVRTRLTETIKNRLPEYVKTDN